MKAKVDTGARTSTLHAFSVANFERGGDTWVRFAIHPWQRSAADVVVVETELIDERSVTSSSGTTTLRPVVATSIAIGGRSVPIELTLSRRDEMGFRMLIGRQAMRGLFVVDPARSYVHGRPDRMTRRKNSGRR